MLLFYLRLLLKFSLVLVESFCFCNESRHRCLMFDDYLFFFFSFTRHQLNFFTWFTSFSFHLIHILIITSDAQVQSTIRYNIESWNNFLIKKKSHSNNEIYDAIINGLSYIFLFLSFSISLSIIIIIIINSLYFFSYIDDRFSKKWLVLMFLYFSLFTLHSHYALHCWKEGHFSLLSLLLSSSLFSITIKSLLV